MKAQERYRLACIALKTQWETDFDAYADYAPSWDKNVEHTMGITKAKHDVAVRKIEKELNDLARTFLHFEKLAKVKFQISRPKVMTRAEFKKECVVEK